MSQVRKYKTGSVLKAQEGSSSVKEPQDNKQTVEKETPKNKYGHLIIDGRDMGNSEDVWNAFWEYSRRQPLAYGEYFGRWLNMLKNGQDVIFSSGNGVNENGGMSERKHNGWNKFWQAMSPTATDAENFRSAIASARGFVFKEASKTPDINEYNNYRGYYDWDTVGDKKVYSKNPGNLALDERFDTYLDWLEDSENWEKSNKFKNKPEDSRLAGLKAWWNAMGDPSDENDKRTQRERARAYIDEYRKKLQAANGWNNVDEGVREFLDYFNIGETPQEVQAAAAAAQAAQQSAATYNGNVSDTGQIKPGTRNDGKFGVFIGDGNNGYEKDAVYTTMQTDPNRPYLITPERLSLFNGLDDSFIDAVVWNNRIWKQPEFVQNEWLRRRMEDVTREHNSATTSADMFARVSPLLNYTDDEQNKYVDYNRQISYRNDELDPNKTLSKQAYLRGNALAKQLAEGNYALSDPTGRYLTNGDTIYEVYDFNRTGEGNYGFRKPFYLIFGADGNLKATTEDPNNYRHASISYADSGKNPISMNNFRSWQNINGKDYGLLTNVWGSDNHDKTPYQIYEDRDGIFYTKHGDGSMIRLDEDLVEWILQENKPNHNQMLNGTLNGEPRNISDETVNQWIGIIQKRGYQEGSTGLPIMQNWKRLSQYQKEHIIKNVPEIGEWAKKYNIFKSGGTIVKPRELPKYQYGGKTIPIPTEISSLESQETPLRTSSNLWETLTPADQKEITAAAIDVAGAIAGLTGPVGSVAGAVSGLGSTGLFMSAAKERKGSLDAGDWGQAALATGLDLVSIIPYLGETGKIAKVGKAVTRVAVPLGKAFSALGLVEAASVLKKKPKDWDTNDLLKLSAGLQAVIGIGHRTYQKSGESAIAHEISKIRGTKPETISHKYKIGDTDIELSAQEIDAITNPKNNAEEILSGILKGKGVKDEQLKNIPSLLEMFGFDTSKKGLFKRHTVATAKEPKQPVEYSKYGYLADLVMDPLGNREFARRAYIDANMQKNSRIRPKIDDLIATMDKTNAKVIRNPREEIIIEGTRTPIDKTSALARGYAEARARLGEVPTSFKKIARIDDTPEEVVKVNRIPTQEVVAEDIIANPRVKTPYVEGPTERILSVQTQNTPAGKAPGVKNINTAEGMSDLSDQQIVAMFGRADKQQVIDLLSALPEDRRALIIESLKKSNSEKIRSAIRDLGERPLRSKQSDKAVERVQRKRKRDLMERLGTLRENAASMYNPREIRSRENAREEARQIAKNIKALQNSKDPMETLIQLSKDNPGFDQRVYDNPEKFRAALETSFDRAWGNKKPRFIKEKRAKLDQLLDELNLLMKNGGKLRTNVIDSFINRFAKGGILKGQNGIPPVGWQKSKEEWDALVSNPNISWDEFNTLPQEIQDALIEQNENLDFLWDGLLDPAVVKPGPDALDMQSLWLPDSGEKPLDEVLKETYGTDFTPTDISEWNKEVLEQDVNEKPVPHFKSSKEQGLNLDLTNLKEALTEGSLAAMDYGSMAWGRHKVHDQIEKGLKDSLYRKTTPRLQGINTATPIEDAAVMNADKYIQRGLTTPLTSDNVANTANVLSLQEQGLKNRENAVRQQSAAAFQRQQANQQIANQQATLDAEAENDFRARLAGLKYNLKQNDASLTAQTAQSLQNLAREWREKFNTDKEGYRNLAYNQAVTTETERMNNQWLSDVQNNHKDLWDKWNAPDVDKSKYGNDFNIWAQNTNNWSGLEAEYTANRKALNNSILDIYKTHKLRPFAQGIYRDIPATGSSYLNYGFKKGGKIGTNRYKNEPDEDIWINQNKATHKLVAKLNDNIIKTFLKTLK